MAKTNVHGVESRLLRAAFHQHNMFVETAILNNIVDTFRSIPATDISLSSLEKRVDAEGNTYSICLLELHPFVDAGDQSAAKYIIHTAEHGAAFTNNLSVPTYTFVNIPPETYVPNISRTLTSDSGRNESFTESSMKLQPDQSKHTTANTFNVTEIIAEILKEYYPNASHEIDTKASFITTGQAPQKAEPAPQRSPKSP